MVILATDSLLILDLAQSKTVLVSHGVRTQMLSESFSALNAKMRWSSTGVFNQNDFRSSIDPSSPAEVRITIQAYLKTLFDGFGQTKVSGGYLSLFKAYTNTIKMTVKSMIQSSDTVLHKNKTFNKMINFTCQSFIFFRKMEAKVSIITNHLLY